MSEWKPIETAPGGEGSLAYIPAYTDPKNGWVTASFVEVCEHRNTLTRPTGCLFQRRQRRSTMFSILELAGVVFALSCVWAVAFLVGVYLK